MKRTTNSTRVKAPTRFRCAVGGAVPLRLSPTDTSPEFMTGATSTSSRGGGAPITAHTMVLKSRKSNARIDLRAGLSVGTWNVLTLNRTGYVTALVRSLKVRQLSLVGITEARLTGSNSTLVEGQTVLHSGGVHHTHGVALVVDRKLAPSLIQWTPISDRLLSARFTHRHGHMTAVVAYAPTEDSTDEDKDLFYDQLDGVISHVAPQDFLVVLGDMNAVTGTDRSGFESVIGRFGSGVVNDNSHRLLSLCASSGLAVMGSWFRRPDMHRWTWYSNDGFTKKEIDNVIVRQRDRGLVKSHRVYRGSEAPASTDHRLVVAVVALCLPYCKKPQVEPRRIDTDRLRSDASLALRYTGDVQRRLTALGGMVDDDVELTWEKQSGAIREASISTVGYKRNIKQPWMTDATFDILQLKAAARVGGHTLERRRLQGIFNAMAKADREAFLNRLADEAQEGLRHNNLRPAYRAIKLLTGKGGSSTPAPVEKLDGSACSTSSEIQQRWQEHYESVLNFPPASPCPDLVDLAGRTQPNLEVCSDPPTLAEVRRAVGKLKSGRAAGRDNITPELLLCAIGPVSSCLHALFKKIWSSGRVPVDWKDGVIIPLYKGKGARTVCGNYRPISLLSVPGKVFAHVLLDRLTPLFRKHRRPEQSGFTAGRSAADAILALRLLSEIHREFNRPLCVAYVDLKSAFDSVDRSALWLALRGIGTPVVLLSLLRELHTNTGARVRVGASISDRFGTSSGVRQGCVLAPALFNRAIDWIMDNAVGLKGIKVGDLQFRDLDYADDIALPVSDPSDLSATLAGFAASSKTMGLDVSWTKTKVQSLGTGPPVSSVAVLGQNVDVVSSFTYLGSVIDSSCRCTLDILRRIGIASSSMGSLSRAWSQGRLSLVSKLRIYSSCIMSVLLYGSETWTILAADLRRLQAFHMRSQRRILGIRWQDRIRNTVVTDKTGLPHIQQFIDARRTALFGHVARLDEQVPANRALLLAVNIRAGLDIPPSWRRPRGRPRDTWLKPLQKLGGSVLDQWSRAVSRGHSSLAQRP